MPDGAVDTITCGDGNDTVFLSVNEGDFAESDCENVNPSSFEAGSKAMILLGNATENSQSNRADIDQNCELAVAQSNGILKMDLCQKIKLSLNETSAIAPWGTNNTRVQSESTANITQKCPDIISKGSDDVAVDICNSFISMTSNQTDVR